MKTTVYNALPRETAADEERAALAQEAAHHRDVEVDAGGDVRQRESLVVDDVRHQQVVHVAAMAGHVDHLIALRHLLERAGVVDLHAVVDAVPHAAQQFLGELHERVRVVSGDLEGVLARLQQARDGTCRASPAPRPRPLRAPPARATPARRSCAGARGPGRCAIARCRRRMPRRMRVTRRAWSCAGEASSRERRLNRLAHLHHDVAAVDEHRDELAHARGQRPVLGEQQPQPGALFLRRAAPVHRGGHQQHVAHGIGAAAPRPAPAGMAADGVSAWHPRSGAGGPHRNRSGALPPAGCRNVSRDTAAPCARHIAQHREVSHRIAFEHVTHGHARLRQRRRRLGGLHGGPHPELEESSQQPAHAFKRATRRMMLGAGV